MFEDPQAEFSCFSDRFRLAMSPTWGTEVDSVQRQGRQIVQSGLTLDDLLPWIRFRDRRFASRRSSIRIRSAPLDLRDSGWAVFQPPSSQRILSGWSVRSEANFRLRECHPHPRLPQHLKHLGRHRCPVLVACLLMLAPPPDGLVLHVDVRPPQLTDGADAVSRLVGDHQGHSKRQSVCRL